MIHINDAPEKAKRIFLRLIEDFESQNINPTPLNYYVWYEYLKGDNPEFRQEMEAILKDPFGYNDRVGKRLYEEFLQEESDGSTEFDRAFRRLINLMIKKMTVWGDKLEQQTKDLNDCANSLSKPGLDSNELKRITDTMIHTAQSMSESSKAFQQEMIMGSEEVRQLRHELITAQTAALTDELTELGNRKAFNQTLEELLMENDDNQIGNDICLILSDIDHFKAFNDNYGHLIGDSVLRYYANIMKKHQRKNETICRFGGEEFAILLSNSSLEEARERSEEIREAIEAAVLKRKNSNEPLTTITASFGISLFHGKNDSAEALINRADKALYLAKEMGRNQVKDEKEVSQKSFL
jgi:diguanylate cyclase